MRTTDPTRNRHGNDAQSREAWQLVKSNVHHQRKLVLMLIAGTAEDGMTSHECAERLGFPGAPHRVSGRFTELKTAGFITLAALRPTPTGCSAKAYKITEHGRLFLS